MQREAHSPSDVYYQLRRHLNYFYLSIIQPLNYVISLLLLKYSNIFLYNYSDQAEARRQKVKEAKKRRAERLSQKKQELLQSYQKEDEAAAAAAAVKK